MLQRVEWNDEFEIGIGVIDNQHKRIVEYINTLADMNKGTNPQEVDRLLNALVDYTLSHFAFEESLMEEAGYEYLTVHQGTHHAFIRKIEQMHNRFKNGEDVSLQLGELLLTWLLEHIQNDDQSYAPLVRDQFNLIESKSDGNWVANALNRFFK
ncbi:MAG: bacteriohemerythrin [Gammaproteobacteria bacterium]|nr:bacteriohemerythrin [Gammaproteobacteria bacterium]